MLLGRIYIYNTQHSNSKLLVLDVITRTVVSASVLTWFLRYIDYPHWHFLQQASTKFLLPETWVTLADFWLFYLGPVEFFFNYLDFKYFGFERTRWRLFQKRVMRTEFDIYVITKHTNNVIEIDLILIFGFDVQAE
jgi:hypothetical protein